MILTVQGLPTFSAVLGRIATCGSINRSETRRLFGETEQSRTKHGYEKTINLINPIHDSFRPRSVGHVVLCSSVDLEGTLDRLLASSSDKALRSGESTGTLSLHELADVGSILVG